MSRLRLAFPALYRFAAMLALLAMLSPLGATAAMAAQHPAAQKLVHICGIASAKPITQKNGKAAPHKLPSCPICVALHALGGGLIAPAAPTLAFASTSEPIFTAQPDNHVQPRLIPPQARPRAPPALV